jgi:hypothetical protein
VPEADTGIVARRLCVHDFTMLTAQRRPASVGVIKKVLRVAGAVTVAAAIGYAITGRRGWVFGLLAFLTYASLTGAAALSFSSLRQWTSKHAVLDSLGVVPLSFFPLLLISALPWWVAALIALAAGLLFAAWQPRRASGLLPLAVALSAGTLVSSIADMVAGRVPAVGEAHHALDLAGVALLVLVARAGSGDTGTPLIALRRRRPMAGAA